MGYELGDLGELLDNFTKATGIYIDAVNLSGESLIQNRECKKSEFCKLIQISEEGKYRCQKSYKNATKECIKWNEPYFFRCHAGIVMWSLPIVIEQKHMGSIICGQVLLWKPDKFFYKELKQLNEDIVEFEALEKKVGDLSIISASKCKSIVSMLSIFVNYLLKNNSATQNNEKKMYELRNQMLKEIEERKIEYQNFKFDNSVYIKREKTLLQYIRTGSNENVSKLLPIVCSDIDILCRFDLELVKQSCKELMVMISRAAVDGGIETDLSLNIARKFNDNIDTYNNSEELFINLNKTISTLLDMIYILGDNNQNTILKNARKYIEINYNKKITIENVAENSYVSTYYLCHLFKTNLNITINDYITRTRVEKSIELMKKRELSISDIMKEVGFNSQSHFTKKFKKIVGVTPGSYRNKFL